MGVIKCLTQIIQRSGHYQMFHIDSTTEWALSNVYHRLHSGVGIIKCLTQITQRSGHYQMFNTYSTTEWALSNV